LYYNNKYALIEMSSNAIKKIGRHLKHPELTDEERKKLRNSQSRHKTDENGKRIRNCKKEYENIIKKAEKEPGGLDKLREMNKAKSKAYRDNKKRLREETLRMQIETEIKDRKHGKNGKKIIRHADGSMTVRIDVNTNTPLKRQRLIKLGVDADKVNAMNSTALELAIIHHEFAIQDLKDTLPANGRITKQRIHKKYEEIVSEMSKVFCEKEEDEISVATALS
jgi:hypothetical protein